MRGSTYSAQVLPTTVAQDPVGVHKTAEKKKLKEMQASAAAHKAKHTPVPCAHDVCLQRRTNEKRAAPRTPDAVDGRRHMDIQTET